MRTSWEIGGVGVEVTVDPLVVDAGRTVLVECAEGGQPRLPDGVVATDEMRERLAATSGSDARPPGTVRRSEDGVTPQLVVGAAPTWVGGHRSEFVQLERIWQSALDAAKETGCPEVAAAAIATGAAGFPVPEASRVAFNTVVRFAQEGPGAVSRVRVHVPAADLETWLDGLDEVMRTMTGTPGAR